MAAWLLTQDSQYWVMCAELLQLVTDTDLQQAYFKSCTSAHRLLDPDEDAPLLEVFGSWKIDEAAPLLRHYALWSEDHHEMKYATLGWVLGGFPVSEADWARAEELMALPLMPDYVPLLFALKPATEWPAVLERFKALGDHISSSSLAGIVLAFGRMGAQARPYLLHAMKSPEWEAYDAGSGPLRAMYLATVWQQWPLESILDDLQHLDAATERGTALFTWYHLLLLGVREVAQPFQSWEKLETEAFVPWETRLPLREWSQEYDYDVLYDMARLAIQVKCI